MLLSCYDNRELSWLKFNERVLEEAQDENVPLFERLGFASIFQSNLDEFFMIRVGSLYDGLLVGDESTDNKTNMSIKEQLHAIFKRVKEIEPLKDEAYHKIMLLLDEYGIEQVMPETASEHDMEYLKTVFQTEIKGLISPLIVDKRYPFPFLKNKEIYVAMHLESKSGIKIGILPVNEIFSRIIVIPGERLRFILAEDLIMHFAPLVFKNYKVNDKALIRITRNADINAEEALYDHEVDYRDAMEELLKKRKKLSPVRLQIYGSLKKSVLEFLCEKLGIKESQVFPASAPLDLSFIYELGGMTDKKELFFPKLTPQKSACVNDDEPMIEQIKKKDILLTFPYESIKPFLRLLNEAADDKDVVSVRITLYRLAKNSSVIEALVNLAEKGKDVQVLVELRARFDEENNISWSRRLQDAGCTVIFGPHDFKVHSKLLLITRKNGKGVDYITQIGTGNYNEKTSTLYTDLSLITADMRIGEEAGMIFNALFTGNFVEDAKHFLVAPLALQNKVIDFIENEIEEAKAGKLAYIGCKLNSLTDKTIIDKIIEASSAGVRVELLVRGICCLVAGVPGYTENIQVTSIVGRFLEHSRIYIFGTEERQKMYISSADFMTRNTLRRVEVAAPVYDADIRARINEMFRTMLSDNVKTRKMLPGGIYRKSENQECPLDSQIYFYEQAYKNAEKLEEQLKQSKSEKLAEIYKRAGTRKGKCIN